MSKIVWRPRNFPGVEIDLTARKIMKNKTRFRSVREIENENKRIDDLEPRLRKVRMTKDEFLKKLAASKGIELQEENP